MIQKLKKFLGIKPKQITLKRKLLIEKSGNEIYDEEYYRKKFKVKISDGGKNILFFD